MSSDFPDYGRLHSKSVYLSEDGMRIHANADDTKSVTLKVTPSGAGNVDIALPTTAGTLMKTDDDVDSRNMVNGELLTSVTPTDTDNFLVFDASDSDGPKRVTGADLKTYVGGANLSPGDIDNANLFAAGVVDTAALGADAVTSAKLADDCVTGDHIASGAINAAPMLAPNVVSTAALGALQVTAGKIANDAITTLKVADSQITNAKLAGSITTSKLVDGPGTLGTVEASKFVSVDANKDMSGARHVTADGTVQAGAAEAFRLGGDADNSWRVMISGGNLVFQKKETGTWNTKHTITSS